MKEQAARNYLEAWKKSQSYGGWFKGGIIKKDDKSKSNNERGMING